MDKCQQNPHELPTPTPTNSLSCRASGAPIFGLLTRRRKEKKKQTAFIDQRAALLVKKERSMEKLNGGFVFHIDDDVEFISADFFELMNVSLSAPYNFQDKKHVLWINHQVGRSVGLSVLPSTHFHPSVNLLSFGVVHIIAQLRV